MDDEYVKKLVVARLKTMPPDISFSVGSHGDFTRDEIIKQVINNSEVGKEFIQLEMRILIDSPRIIGRLSGKKASSY